MRSKRLFVQKARVRTVTRLNPAGTAAPAASAKEENRKNNDEKYLDIHGVQAVQRDGFGFGSRLPKVYRRSVVIAMFVVERRHIATLAIGNAWR
jgi:hypothetical protein